MQNLREYFRPRSVDEAVDLKKQYGPRAAYLAGGSDLLVHRPVEIETVIDIRHCDIGYARRTTELIVIGGAALLRDAERAAAETNDVMLLEAFRHTAPWLIRNSACLAGNIANASPAADAVPALLAADARLVLAGDTAELISLHEIFDAPHRTKLGDRLIREVQIPLSGPHGHGVFVKLARSASDIALVNVAVFLELDGDTIANARIALGAVSPVPMRARRAERLVIGGQLSRQVLANVQQAVTEEVRPISDWRASAAYRRRMTGVLVRRAIEQVYQESQREAS